MDVSLKGDTIRGYAYWHDERINWGGSIMNESLYTNDLLTDCEGLCLIIAFTSNISLDHRDAEIAKREAEGNHPMLELT